MKKEEIHLYDLKRIILGNAPAEFLLEVVIRSVITYMVLLIIVRLMGKRMSGKLTYTEISVMLMLGAIVSSAMQIPERGIIEGCFVLVLVLLLQRLVTLWMFKSSRVEDKILSKMYLLIKDGVLQKNDLSKEYITRTQLFGMLRSRNVTNLGGVKRLYMETSGAFTLYKNKNPLPGLSVLPCEDDAVYNSQSFDKDSQVCNSCGTLYEASHLPSTCFNCGEHEFVPAVKG
jgi:uncharacterized membrane protein YcaP (DUF421 family)